MTSSHFACGEAADHTFRLRAAWDGKQYGALSNDDIEWLDQANQRFGGSRIERLYQIWGSGDAGKQQWRSLRKETYPPRSVEFRTCLVTAGGQAKPKELRGAGEVNFTGPLHG